MRRHAANTYCLATVLDSVYLQFARFMKRFFPSKAVPGINSTPGAVNSHGWGYKIMQLGFHNNPPTHNYLRSKHLRKTLRNDCAESALGNPPKLAGQEVLCVMQICNRVC